MIRYTRYTVLTLLLVLVTTIAAIAQSPTADEARKEARNQQSIYMVMTVAVTIMVGLFIYLFTLDRKISKIEKGKL
jgi:cytochrome bd-type quinol oxidase subunit 2